jgi:DNA-binding transcriptional LysR family regulator
VEVNPVHVRTLRAVVRRASFSRAAEALGLSQPAVSHQIRHLESAVGAALVQRVGRRAVVTAAGALLLGHAERAFAELEVARQAIHRLRGVVAGRVRVGTGATASIYLLPRVLGRLRRAHPELELVVVTGNATHVASAVESGDLDLGLVALPIRGRHLVATPFGSDPLVAIAPPTREWRARRRGLQPRDLADAPLILYEPGGTIRTVIDGWFRAAGVTPRVAMELGNAEAIKKLVEAGLGVSIGSAITIRAEAKAGALLALPLAPPLVRRLALVRRRDRPGGPALDVVFAALQSAQRNRGMTFSANLRMESRARSAGRPPKFIQQSRYVTPSSSRRKRMRSLTRSTSPNSSTSA